MKTKSQLFINRWLLFIDVNYFYFGPSRLKTRTKTKRDCKHSGRVLYFMYQGKNL